MRRNALFLLVVVGLVAAGCGEKTKVGSEELLDIKEQQQKERLGEILKSPQPTATATAPAALGVPSESPKAEAKQEVFEVTLVAAPDYYEPGQLMQIAAGTRIKVTNRDSNLWENAQKPRRFRASNGPYDTGDIPLGESREFVASTKGRFQIEDPNYPSATATMEVY